ncbi:MAG: hypothetical protein QXJ56_05390 [Ignisphaera sp.]|uniref:Uncharacterized protein n=1 Tax=Ignisphaera aggregans TaxID=334771 RepID=A0A7J3JQ08_9CREN
MPFINLCLDRREPLIRLILFDRDGKSIAEYGYRDIDLIEIKGTVRIDYSAFVFPKNMLCISIESDERVEAVGRVLKIG